MKKEIRVLVVEPMRKPYVKTIPDTLEAINQVIEGDCMQVVPLYGMNIIRISIFIAQQSI